MLMDFGQSKLPALRFESNRMVTFRVRNWKDAVVVEVVLYKLLCHFAGVAGFGLVSKTNGSRLLRKAISCEASVAHSCSGEAGGI